MMSSTNQPLRINVLGPLEIELDGERVGLRSRKQRILLAMLLIQQPRSVSADRLVDVLWSDELPEAPLASLQVHISRLRRTLGATRERELILTEPPGYRLDEDRLELDSAAFERLVNEARCTSDPEEGLDDVAGALALWRGAAFAEFAELDFARGEAARLEELRFAAMELQGELLADLGRFQAATSAFETVIAADALRERPRDGLARSLYHLGRQADALAVCREYRRVVSEELGLDPSPTMERLEREILAHELDDPGATVPDPGDRKNAPPPVGPELEIGYVETCGRTIAVGVAGTGPTLVVLPGFVSNLGTIAEGRDPRSRLLARLAEDFRIVTYDRFGTGLSPGEVDDYSTAASVDELGGLLDALGESDVAMLAISCAGPIAVTVAAHRPETISRLIFLGTYAGAGETFGDPAVSASICDLVRAHWGLGSKLLMDLMYPSASADFIRMFARGQREAAPVEVAARYLETMFEADATERLSQVAAPSLVIHYTGDRAIPFRGARSLAASIPGARLVPMGGSLHLPEGTDADRVAVLIRDFVTT